MSGPRHLVGPVMAMAVALQVLLFCGFSGAAELSGINDAVVIEEWHYLGPFSVGAREGIASPGVDPDSLDPRDAGRYPSVLVQGGFAEWRRTSPDSTGWVNTEFESVLWDTLMDIYGYAGIVNAAYAYAEFEMPGEARAVVMAEKTGTFYLNGRPYPGDPYGHDFMMVPVLVRQGTNRVLIRLSGYGDHRFRFEVLPPPAPVITLDDYTVPDISEGESGELWLGVPLLNTTTEWIHEAVIELGDGMHVARGRTRAGSLAPLCVKKVPVKIETIACEDSTGECRIPLRVVHDGSDFSDTLTLRVRSSGQSIKRTFISAIDSSCQYYAVLPPTDYDPGQDYALIYTLHGASVRAEGQVDAYKAKPWAYVVAPTNRRRFGFDWQDWGRLDALEVLDTVKRTLPIDKNRVYLTGHSMGGHGVWHVGLSHPDLFAAMAPGAGWTSFELYVPWFLQKAYIFGDPAARAIRERALLQDWPHHFVENARNLPIFILQGGADDNVPPFHARLFVQRLEQLGYDYTYKEDPGRVHWWSIDSLEVSCVDDPDLIGFFPGKSRRRLPRHVTFKTASIACCNRSYWIEIAAQDIPYRDSWIDAVVSRDTIGIDADNVRSLKVTLSRQLIPGGHATIRLDGRTWTLRFRDQRVVTFSRRNGEFRLGEAGPSGLAKSPDLFGPIKQTTFSPFALVYGTRGDSVTTRLLLHQARLEAFRWWRRANGLVEILPDSAVTPGIMAGRNLILFGGPEENEITGRIDRFLPIHSIDGSLYLGDRKIPGSGIGACFVYPNPLNPLKLVTVCMGSDPAGLELSTFFKAVYSGSGLPDFIIFDSSVRSLGWGGMIAAGFFDSRWRIDESLCYLRHR